MLDEEKLISLVNQYPELYNLENEHYLNTNRKNNIWKGIANEMGVRDVVCKEKWKTLRDSYHRNLKRRKFKSQNGTTKYKKWKYERQMEFLRPYFTDRASKNNVEDSGSITSDDNSNNESYHPVLMAVSPEPVNSSLPSSSVTSLMFKSITARKKNQEQHLSVASVLQNYLDSRPDPIIEDVDPIHSFFRAMTNTVMVLPPDLQLKAKNKIYGIVSELEYENLLRDSMSSYQAETSTGYDLNKEVTKPQLDLKYENILRDSISESSSYQNADTSTSYESNKELVEPVSSMSEIKTFTRPQNMPRLRFHCQRNQTVSSDNEQELNNNADNSDYQDGMESESQAIPELKPNI